MMHSFYFLTIDVEPGSARKNDSYVFSTREEIMEALKRDLEGGDVLFVGGKYVLRVYNEGRKFWEKDLLPYVTFHIPGYLPLKCDERRGVLHLKESRIRQHDPKSIQGEDDEDLDEQDKLVEILSADSMNENGTISVEIDWEAVAIPKVESNLAQKGEPVYYIEDEDTLDEIDWEDWETTDYGYCHEG